MMPLKLQIQSFARLTTLLAVWAAAYPSQAQWRRNSGPGPYDYGKSANWYNGRINNLFTATPADGLNLTFSADWLLSTQVLLGWNGSPTLTFRSDSARPRTLKLSGDILRTNNSGGSVILGTPAQPLVLDLNGGTRQLGATAGSADGSLLINAKIIDSSSGAHGLKLGGGRLYTSLLNDSNSFRGPVEFSSPGGAFTSIKPVGVGPSALGAPTDAVNGTITITDNNSPGGLVYLGAGDASDRPFSWANVTGNTFSFQNQGTGKLTLSGPWTLPPGNFTINAASNHIQLDGWLSKGMGTTNFVVFQGGSPTNQITLTCPTNDFPGVALTNVILAFASIADAGQPCSLGTAAVITHQGGQLMYIGTNNAVSDRSLCLQGPSTGGSFGLFNNSPNNSSLHLSSPAAWTLAPNLRSGTLSLGGTATATNILDAQLPSPAAGNLDLAVSGSTWVLNGANSLAGQTTVYDGATLVVNGSLSTNPLTVNSGAALAGAGVISGPVALQGTVSPGWEAPGTLTTGPLVLGPGSTVNCTINSASGTAGADPGWGLLNDAGLLTIAATPDSPITINLTAVNSAGAPDFLTDFNSAEGYAWPILNSAAPVTSFAPALFKLNTVGLPNSLANGAGQGVFSVALDSSGQNVLVLFTGYPAITAGPVDSLAVPGSSATFSVTATGGFLIYQWQKNGEPIPGATMDTLNLPNVQNSDAAAYSVIVSNAAGVVASSSANLQLSQDIAFAPLPDLTYGAAPFALAATASSSLPVSYSLLSGPATLSGNTVTVTGAGVVTIRAEQAGNTFFTAASAVTQSFTVVPRVLTVTADNQSRVYGTSNPPPTVSYSGFVNGETAAVLSGAPSLSSAAISSSTVAGSPYTISVTRGTLSGTNYSFVFVNGALTVTPASTVVTLNASAYAPLNNPVTFTARVAAAAPSVGTPTGTLQLLTNGVVVGSPVTLVKGSASLMLSLPPGSTTTVGAHYAGDGNFLAGATNVVQVVASPPQVPFPLMMYEVATNEAANLAPYGWNIVQSYGLNTNADYNNYLQGVLPYNVAGDVCIPGSNGGTAYVEWPQAQVQNWIRASATNANLPWWDLPEEMRYWVASELKLLTDYTAWTRLYDPWQRPTYEYMPNNRNPVDVSKTAPAVDILGISCYCEYANMPHAWVRYRLQQCGVQGLALAGKKLGRNYLAGEKNLMAVLYCAKAASGMPTPAQSYHDFWSAIASGAQGISVFAYWHGLHDDPALTNNLQQLNLAAAQISGPQQLGQALLYGSTVSNAAFSVISGPTQTVAFTPPNDTNTYQYPSLNVLTKSWSKNVYVIAVNSTDQPLTACISNLPTTAASAPLPFESRSVMVNNGSFTDSFPAWGVHIYVMPDPPIISAFTAVGKGVFQFSVSDSGVSSYTVLASTNLTGWAVVGSATNLPALLPSGRYQFSDPAASGASRRFYRLRWP